MQYLIYTCLIVDIVGCHLRGSGSEGRYDIAKKIYRSPHGGYSGQHC